MKQQISTLHANLKIQHEQATATLLEFSAEPTSVQEACAKEVSVVRHRLAAAEVVSSTGNDSESAKVAVADYVKQFARSGASSEGGGTVGPRQSQLPKSSSDNALRTGPCPGFQHFLGIPHLLAEAESLKDAGDKFTDMDSLISWVDKFEPSFRAIAEITKALRVACDYLYQARSETLQAAGAENTARKKQAAKRTAQENCDAKKSKLLKTAQDSVFGTPIINMLGEWVGG